MPSLIELRSLGVELKVWDSRAFIANFQVEILRSAVDEVDGGCEKGFTS